MRFGCIEGASKSRVARKKFREVRAFGDLGGDYK